MRIREELVDLQKTLYDFSRRNPFINVNTDKLALLEDNKFDHIVLSKLTKKADFYRKEYGLETTLHVYLFLQWEFVSEQSKEIKSYFSPLVYKPCKIVKKRNIEIDFKVVENDEDHYSINPILRHYFAQYFDFILPELINDICEISELLTNFFKTADKGITIKNQFSEEVDGWAIYQQEAIGNFNYKKSLLGTDYDTIIKDPNITIEHLLGGQIGIENSIDTQINLIAPADDSQSSILVKTKTQNLVIQGPPGTGKSHTISNIIGHHLLAGKRILLVSEKRAALDVVHTRLKKIGIDKSIAFFNVEKDEKKTFYSQLGKTYEAVKNADAFSQIEKSVPADRLLVQYYPALLLNERGKHVTLNKLITLLLDSSLSLENLKAKGKFPDYSTWFNASIFLEDFETKVLPVFAVNTLSQTPFYNLNKAVFNEDEPIQKLESFLLQLEEALEKIVIVQKSYNLNHTIYSLTRVSLTASVLNMVNKLQLDLLNKDHKSYKSFKNWAKKYQLTAQQLKRAEQANKDWKKKPSQTTITVLLDLIQNKQKHKNRKGIFYLLKRNPEQLRTAFTDFDPNISDEAKILLLEKLKLEWQLRSELEEIKIKLKHNLNINDPENEIDLIFSIRAKLDDHSTDEYLEILGREDHEKLIVDLANLHPAIDRFNAIYRFVFRGDKQLKIIDIQDQIAHIKKMIPAINHWLPEIKHFYKLPNDLQEFIGNNVLPIRELKYIVAYESLLKETRFESAFKDLSGWALSTALKEELQADKWIFKSNIEKIKQAQRTVYQYKENLLATPQHKLNEAEKLEKKNYRIQKRVLLHEINKKQQHLPVKDLVAQTGEYIMALQPVWIMNPLAVSEYLPNTPDLFDLIIFDESSQIPLEDAIPAIYRAKQVIIVGDSKQMPPSQFFTSNLSNKTLLDQGGISFPQAMLKWHYRSNHPDLIRFSNQEFYQNELVCLPPETEEIPIEFVLVDGKFDEGKNCIEAERIAIYCAAIPASFKGTIGIIAFSKEQEKEIAKQLANREVDSMYQIVIKNLENAQGIEKDIILISVGYGYNAAGDFRMNFGPVNQVNGANRLNVMFTRAIQKMVVFSSVTAKDFKLSDNQGVQVLSSFLQFTEEIIKNEYLPVELPKAHQIVADILSKNDITNTYYSSKNGIAISCFILHQSRTIILVDPCLDKNDNQDLKSMMRILTTNFKTVKIVLGVDLWLHRDRVEAEIGQLS